MRSPALDAQRSAALVGDDGSAQQIDHLADHVDENLNRITDHIDMNLDAVNRNVNSVGTVATIGAFGVTFLIVMKFLKEMGLR